MAAVRVLLQSIVDALGGELAGVEPATAARTVIERIGPLPEADAATLSFLANPRYGSQLATSKAACVIVAPAMREPAVARGAAIVVDDPYLYFARATQWWAARTAKPAVPGIHPSAAVDPGASVAATASVGPFAVIEAGASVADGAVVGAHCVLEAGASIGAGTRLAPRVQVGHDCRIGARGIVHSGVVIGADGFGFAPNDGRWEKIEQLGAACIGDDVEIGANTCIDRGALGDTVICDGVKIDNLVQIGHNVRIGEHSAVAGCVGIAGSTVIGKHCTLGGAAMISGHLDLADHVHISGGTVVMQSIRKPGVYTGIYPIEDNAAWERNAATLRHLRGLRDRLRALERSERQSGDRAAGDAA